MPSSNHPTPEEIQRLVEKLRHEIVRRFHAQGHSETEAAERVRSALRELSYRWNRVGDRERWLLQALDGEAPKLSTTPEKEPKDE
jgi:transposase